MEPQDRFRTLRIMIRETSYMEGVTQCTQLLLVEVDAYQRISFTWTGSTLFASCSSKYLSEVLFICNEWNSHPYSIQYVNFYPWRNMLREGIKLPAFSYLTSNKNMVYYRSSGSRNGILQQLKFNLFSSLSLSHSIGSIESLDLTKGLQYITQ